MLNTASTTAPATTLVAKTLYNAGIQFWEPSSVYVRRTKYSPYNPEVITAALTQANSWSSSNTVAYTVETAGGSCGSTVTKPAPTAATPTPTPAVAPLPPKAPVNGPAPAPTPAPPPGAATVTPTPSMTSTSATPSYPRTAVGKAFAATLAGTRNGDPINWREAPTAQLMAAHSNQCQYIEDDFEDDFNSETLNTSRWLPVGSVSNPPAGISTASATGKYNTVWGAQPFGGYQVRKRRTHARCFHKRANCSMRLRTTARPRAPSAPPAPAPARAFPRLL